jgi:hypothetical protein
LTRLASPSASMAGKRYHYSFYHHCYFYLC